MFIGLTIDNPISIVPSGFPNLLICDKLDLEGPELIMLRKEWIL